MNEQQKKQLQQEVLEKHNAQINQFNNSDEQIEWLYSEQAFPDFLKRSVYKAIAKIGDYTICLIQQPKKAGIVTLLVIASLLLESENFYHAKPNQLAEIRHEIEQHERWGNLNTPILNGFLILPPPEEPTPHVPEKDLIANPQPIFTIASLSGLSLPISGSYPH